jgi:prolyl 4-hydroxylase
MALEFKRMRLYTIDMIKLSSYVVSTDPKISVIPNFLNQNECQYLIDLSEKTGFTRSFVGRGSYALGKEDISENLQNIYSDNRTSSSVTIPNMHMDETISQIEHRLSGLVGLPLLQLEDLVVVKYQSGQHFGAHHDGIFRPFTVFIYLNDLPENGGGETRFPELNLRIRPRAGTAVMWMNSSRSETDGEPVEDMRLIHEGLPTSDGITKYGVNCFFNYHVMRR